ncbi:MAG TPA: LysR family transcriptional regulator [Bacillota bacterium]|nr:LysR family transcriptional regulator [Bacillota bacterium]
MDQHLHVFVTVVDKKNFSRAAEKLHMTQPAVSQYIHLLEERVGARLLERTNKYVCLTKAGEIVDHHAREILGMYTNMQRLVDDLTKRVKGPLAVGASYTFGEYVLPHVLASLQRQYPDIDPTITIGNTATIADFVTSHQLDVGIVEGHFQDEQVRVTDFAEDRMVVVASVDSPLVNKQQSVSLAELENELWIIRERGSGTREATERMFSQIGIAPHRRMYISSTQPIKEAVEAGLGVSLLSQWAIQKELKNGYLKMVHVKGLPYIRQFSILTKSPYQTKAVETFLDVVQHYEEI